MTIKDAEKLTGLTIKSIRYYEEKRLINIERDKENDYRNYTEEDIERLKLIKILRYIDFSIEEISLMFKENNIQQSLKEKTKELEKESANYLEKQSICESLLKDYKKKKFNEVITDYSDTINFLESDDGKTVKKEFMRMLCPNLSSIIVQSLVYIAPILWLFFNIRTKNWDAMLLNSICAIVCTAFLVLEWNYYFEYRKQFKEILKDKNKKNSLIIPILILTVVICIGIGLLYDLTIQFLFAPKEYLFYEIGFLPTKIMICAVTLLVIIFFCLLLRKLKINKIEILAEDYLFIWDKLKYFIIIIFLIITYCFLTSVTFVKKDKIVYRDPLHPFGITYKYSDVTKIETGFGDKNFSFIDYKRKGQFYYRIYFGKKKFTFSASIPNPKIEKYEDDTYLELEEFDTELEKLNIKKIINNKYSYLCDFDQEFCDRFNRITKN